MGLEYSEGRKKRLRGAQARRRAAYPAAGPVTVIKADGTTEVLPPEKGGDRPNRPRLTAVWRKSDTSRG